MVLLTWAQLAVALFAWLHYGVDVYPSEYPELADVMLAFSILTVVMFVSLVFIGRQLGSVNERDVFLRDQKQKNAQENIPEEEDIYAPIRRENTVRVSKSKSPFMHAMEVFFLWARHITRSEEGGSEYGGNIALGNCVTLHDECDMIM